VVGGREGRTGGKRFAWRVIILQCVMEPYRIETVIQCVVREGEGEGKENIFDFRATLFPDTP